MHLPSSIDPGLYLRVLARRSQHGINKLIPARIRKRNEIRKIDSVPVLAFGNHKVLRGVEGHLAAGKEGTVTCFAKQVLAEERNKVLLCQSPCNCRVISSGAAERTAQFIQS